MTTTKAPTFNERLGAAVRARRVLCGKSQTDVGDVLDVTFQQIQKNERGLNRVSVESLVLIAQYLDTTPQQLIDAALVNDPPAQTGDRGKMEIMRRFSNLSVSKQRIAGAMIKALVDEEAA